VPGHSFDYAVVRVVPRVDREEFLNAGVIVYCRARDFLGAQVGLDRARLLAFAPAPAQLGDAELDLDAIERALALIPRLCAGDAAAGPIAALPQADRFHWLVAPRSTVTQVSPVHAGLCQEPGTVLAHLYRRMVATDAAG
jgi:hypothetical protein